MVIISTFIYVTLILALTILPTLLKKQRSISKKFIYTYSLVLAILVIFINYFTKSLNIGYIAFLLIPSILLFFPDFRLIYNLNKEEIVSKIERLLTSMFCKYQIINEVFYVKKVGKIKVYDNLLLIKILIFNEKEKTKISEIISDNLFKIFYDEEY